MGIYIVRTGEGDFFGPKIMDFIQRKIPMAQSIIGEVEFVDEIPRNIVGFQF